MQREFDVEVVYRQRVVYRVTADDREAAEREGESRWRRGDKGDLAGLDWSEVERILAREAVGEDRRKQDAELVLRFLRERERLISRLGDPPFQPTTGDAISAAQVAADLGWIQSGSGLAGPDLVRATDALERLCDERRVVCFVRPRARVGERGDIRLYCTPDYLERLSDSLGPAAVRAVRA